jgi:hypothetical protein
MPYATTPAILSASIAANISVLRAAAEPARQHARWLETGHVMALAFGELEPNATPVSAAELGDSPAAISEAILRALFGPARGDGLLGRRTVRRPGLEVRELRWDQVAHLFDGTVMQDTLGQEAGQSLALACNEGQNDDGAIEPTTATHRAQGQ